MKKTITVLTMALVLALGAASFSFAQVPNVGQIPPEALEELKKEAPMAQADIDAYIKIMPELGKAATNPAAIAELHKNSGLSEVRLGMIMTKISLAQAMSMGMTAEQLGAQELPEAMKPTPADIELVKKNIDNINAAMTQMQQALPKQ